MFQILQRTTNLSLREGLLTSNSFIHNIIFINIWQFSQTEATVYSPQRPPFSIELFNFGEVTAILKYINNNYLRHYKFYKYLFTQQVHYMI